MEKVQVQNASQQGAYTRPKRIILTSSARLDDSPSSQTTQIGRVRRMGQSIIATLSVYVRTKVSVIHGKKYSRRDHEMNAVIAKKKS